MRSKCYESKKLTMIAINIVLSSLIVIPLGPIKSTVQHFINVLCAVFVGPWYGLAQAFIFNFQVPLHGPILVYFICIENISLWLWEKYWEPE